jgi:hypothetical protein
MAAYTTIDDPSAYFKVQLYTGNGSANHAITFDDTDTDMQPDLVWIKNRDQEDHHCLFDAVRGATKVIFSSDYAVESTDTDTLDSFTSDGFQVDADVKVNTNTEKYVAWCWKANGSGSANTTGSINTTATSAETTSGFSIVHFTGNLTSGATIGHGLGVAPHFIITKSLDAANDWGVFHIGMHADPEDYAMKFNSTAQRTDQVAMWNDTLPSSTLVTLGDEGRSNDDEGMIAYCFAPVKGFSKFGSYVGNGNADAPFVFTGFRPKFLIIRAVTVTTNFILWDNERNPINEGTHCALTPNGVAVDNCNTGYLVMDFLSNGFKYTDTNGIANTSGQTYIYMAFAHSPFVNSNGVPCNAR